MFIVFFNIFFIFKTRLQSFIVCCSMQAPPPFHLKWGAWMCTTTRILSWTLMVHILCFPSSLSLPHTAVLIEHRLTIQTSFLLGGLVFLHPSLVCYICFYPSPFFFSVFLSSHLPPFSSLFFLALSIPYPGIPHLPIPLPILGWLRSRLRCSLILIAAQLSHY